VVTQVRNGYYEWGRERWRMTTKMQTDAGVSSNILQHSRMKIVYNKFIRNWKRITKRLLTQRNDKYLRR
jgi:hypothetical protein